ncbi:nucleotide pyrophosphohydrolase [Candidatus Roizmanbacteria bacterium]|nr:nucleotide pyrophosphohydrolase [Candidatus Roizmanbacteria bacterium]
MGNSLKNVQQAMKAFSAARDWDQFHDPKNLAEALSIEAGETLELFLWKTKEQIEKDLQNPEFKKELSDELADVLHYLVLLADKTGIDLEKASAEKLKEASRRYPVEKSRGNATKYTKLT